ncbi:Glucosidase II beta subunit-like protein [Perkinsela sp. CCAP 1560/4]|nr:Glucosidase II beta subunit-like protein [Perkinsela sp. CCAP 1560/4]|eukprot:KNH08663.1 Glucosidase II beta subunit-like protein [Perkinsela sp. CCAP 1560/4]
MDRAVGQYIDGQCVRTRNSWWFFELCWGKYLGQFHYRDESSTVKEEEIYLFQSTSSDVPATFHYHSDGNAEPYLLYQYVNGSWCQEMNKNRTTEVRAYCNRPGGHMIPHLQFDIVQPNSCHHVVSLYTEALCSFAWFQPTIRTEFIDCFPLPSSDDSTGEVGSEST